MKLAEKILSRSSINEKVTSEFFDEMQEVASKIKTVKLADKDAKSFVGLLTDMLNSIDEVDENDAMVKLEAMKKWLKAKKIEESKK